MVIMLYNNFENAEPGVAPDDRETMWSRFIGDCP
jgi:hypothetical protein